MKATKKQKASAFLCVVLAGVVLFVSAVCIFISKRNKKIEAGLISPSQSESLSEQESAKADEETPFAASSTEQKESDILHTAVSIIAGKKTSTTATMPTMPTLLLIKEE